MADPTEKKPGRDITDLKARLGLQRPVTPAPQPAAPGPTAPDPRRDPFAAQPARPVAVQQQPALIVDAGPPMHIPEMGKRGMGSWIKLAALVVLPALLTFAFGMVWRARLLYNKSIEDAAQIKAEVLTIRKRTQLINDALVKSLKRANKNPDPQLVEDLKALEPMNPPKTDKIFRTNYAMLENVTIDRLFNYYNDTILLYGYVSRFHSSAERMMADLKKAVANQDTMAASAYGIVIDPSGPIPIGNLIMVGAPICKDNQPDCKPQDWVGMKVKTSPASSWSDKMLTGEDRQRVIPIAPDKFQAPQALIGSAEYTALFYYRTQLDDMVTVATRLVASEKDLVKELDEAANKTKVFTF